MNSITSQKLNDLEKHLEVMNFINISIEIQLHYSQNLITTRNQDEINTKNFYGLDDISVSLWKCAIIDIQKLFSEKKDDCYSFKKLLNNLGIETGGTYKELLKNQELISIFRKKIAVAKPTLKKIKDLRDEAYAHKDKNFSAFDIEIDFKEVKILSALANEIIQTIFKEIFGSEIDNSDLYNKENNIIKDLTKYRKNLIDNF